MKRLAVALFLLSSSAVQADTIHLKSGGSLEGVVLKRNEDGVVILLKYATVTVGSFEIESVEGSAASAPEGRLAGWERCFRNIAGTPWGPDLQPLPARLIDSGELKNVPYLVHAAQDVQIAIYGDPDRPAAIEIGVSGTRRTLDAARKDSADLLASFLTHPEDVTALRSLPLLQGKKESEGLVFETSSEPDSRGRETWWISVLHPAALDQARVSDKDLRSMVAKDSPAPLSSPTLVAPAGGKGEPQDVITPFGTEPDKPKRRKTYGGGGRWLGHIHWNHGHVSGTKP
ncbi:MAG TPA: hypothetical protein VKW04_03945 [Planctomycetota bacterium]|nr:hypothetical protein [Planctomycetota bacterium]